MLFMLLLISKLH